MKLDAVLHIPMSEYCCGLDERRIVYRLRCARGDLQRVTLFYADTACRVNPILFTSVPMEKILSDACHDYWQVIVDSPYNRVYYYFQLDDGAETTLYYSNLFTDRLAQDRSEYFKLPFNHRSDIARVPAWAKDAVVYNIFPDSFASGRCEISGQSHSQRFGQQTVRGKLGGTLEGVAQNVDYLKALGVNCVYLNPIFAAGEYHKYDLLDYYHVDPCFGGNEAFRTMVNTLHASGIRVIIDGVFNHCGWHFFAFEDVVKHQEKSRYKDWFYDLTFPVHRPQTPEEIPGYACFAYERMMPKLNTANPEVQKYFCDVGAYWVREYGIDGWRLDVASEVNDGFWRAFRSAVKGENPEALLIGEVWESAGHWLQGDMFDSTMNYDFRKHCCAFFAEKRIDAAAFSGRITDMLMRYRLQMLPARPGAKSPKGGAINMAKITGKYEVLYIIDPTLGEEGTAALVEKFKAMVEAEGTLASVDEWGKRRLAYPINDMAEGYYVLMNFESKPEFPAELERVMKITEGVMRCLTTAVEA